MPIFILKISGFLGFLSQIEDSGKWKGSRRKRTTAIIYFEKNLFIYDLSGPPPPNDEHCTEEQYKDWMAWMAGGALVDEARAS
jgi:hypothetical protein